MLSGDHPGRIFELTEDRNYLGRQTTCQVLLDNVAVSRQHAQILRSHEKFFIEDLRSRNGTFVNGKPVEGRVALNDRDKIRICDIHLRFHLHKPSDAEIGDSTMIRNNMAAMSGPEMRTMEQISDPALQIEGSSSIIRMLESPSKTGNRPSSLYKDVKLRAVLEITEALVKVLNIDELLPRVLNSLFKIFPQAETGYIVLRDPDTGSLDVKTIKSRTITNQSQKKSLQISETIIERVLEKGEAILSADAQEDSRFSHSESIPQLQIHSMMCVPLIAQSSERLGLIELNTRDLIQEFSSEDLEILVSVSSQIILALENARMHEELLSQRDLERDLEFATQIQLGFLPKERPKCQGYQFFDYYEAAMRVGGDYFDYIPLPDGRLAITAGDVSGKGVPAALLMARLYSSVRYRLLMETNAAKVLEALNEELLDGGIGFRFITLVVAVLNPQTHELIIANAGHLPPLLRRGDRSTDFLGLKHAGVPLGIMPQAKYQEYVWKLNSGDTCLFYTDGVTETMNDEEQLFGRIRLAELVSKLPASIDQAIKGIVNDVESFGGHIAPKDDMCLVGIQRLTDLEVAARVAESSTIS
jgi:serine phosphatase RsbU (regulator of sigma subunit)